MTNKELFIRRINLLSEKDIASLLDAVILMEPKNTLTPKPDCPYCGSHSVIRYGHKCRKQRFFCKSCAKTFVPTTHTIMSNSHFPIEVWHEVIRDTFQGNAIDYTAQRIGCSHQAVFDMRHKVLMSLQQLHEINNVCLGDVSEFDETFVLDCYKVTALSPENHAGMAQRQKKGAYPANMCASVQASSVKGRPLPPQSTGQNQVQKN